MSSVILHTEKLCKSFATKEFTQEVLKNLDIDIFEGDFTVIMGSSGSGKSTLLYAMSGMDRPSSGGVYVGSTNISKMNEDQLTQFRRENCGFIFQSIYLLNHMNVIDNVMTAGLLMSSDRDALYQKTVKLLADMGLGDKDMSKMPDQLSGGEKQRVAIVRAIINEPRILFADEPTGALNSASSKQVLDTFSKLNGRGQSIVLVTHDVKSALRGNRIIYLKDGTVNGELALPPYENDDIQLRDQKLKTFLGEMGW